MTLHYIVKVENTVERDTINMKINELEEQLQISRANIRFYEKEGLIHPKRQSNGYREYSEEDLTRLKKIIIFRKLGLPIPEIRDILEGTLLLSDAIEKNIENLNQQIKELNGALDVCKTITKDTSASTNFDEEYYWNLIHEKEDNGQRFVEFVKDYLEFEKQSLVNMFGTAFFYDLDGSVKRHGWMIALGILFVICIGRGIVSHIWRGESFLYGFSYPLMLFAILSLISFPIFILNRKYKDQNFEEEHVKSSKLKSFLKIIGAILYIPALIIGLPILLESIVTEIILGNDTLFLMTSDLYMVYIAAGFCLFAILLYLYSKHGVFGSLKVHFPGKIKRKVTLYSTLVFLFATVIYLSWFNIFTEKGVTMQHFFSHREYTWTDVDHYTLSAGHDGILNFIIVMKDGTRADMLGGSISMSNFPEDTYPDGEEDFGRRLAEMFSDMGVELRVDDWDELYEELGYDYWADYAKELRRLAGE